MLHNNNEYLKVLIKGVNMKKDKTSSKLSLIASTCFFLTYIMTKQIINFILSLAWLIITIEFYLKYRNEK